MSRPLRDPVRASAQLEEALSKLGVPAVAANVRIRRDWRDLASEPWGDRSRPVVLEEGCLVLEVASPMDATLLRYGAAGLVEHLNKALGSPLIRRVRVRVAPSWQ